MPFQASRAQKRLADELFQRRAGQGLSHRDVAGLTGWSTAKVSRIENAITRVEPTDVRKLATLYKVSDRETERLCAMAGDNRADMWWMRYQRWLSASFVDYLGHESEASVLWTVQTTFVPGLLQTPAYIDQVVSGGPGQDSDRADAESEVRLLRQRRLYGQNALTLKAILGAPVIYWQFGGPSVLCDQLRHLLTMADKPNVSIRIVPYDRATSMYTLDYFEFDGDDRAIVFNETQWGMPVHEDALEVRQARREVARLETVALSEADTIKLIEQRIGEFE